jgi:hypothetical protein
VYGRERGNRTMGWALATLAAAFIFGFIIYSFSGPRDSSTAANPPAVTSAPAPAAGVPAPPPEQTTGQAAPRAQ